MKKRALCITMAMALAVTTFTACGEKKNNGAPTGKKDKKEKVFDFSDDEVFVLTQSKFTEKDNTSKTTILDNCANEVFAMSEASFNYSGNGVIRSDCPVAIGIEDEEKRETTDDGYVFKTYNYGLYDLNSAKWIIEPTYANIDTLVGGYEYVTDKDFDATTLLFAGYSENYDKVDIIDYKGNIILDDFETGSYGGVSYEDGNIIVSDYESMKEKVYDMKGERLEERDSDMSGDYEPYDISGYTISYNEDGTKQILTDPSGNKVADYDSISEALGGVSADYMFIEDVNSTTGMYSGTFGDYGFVCNAQGRCVYQKDMTVEENYSSPALTDSGYMLYDLENDKSIYYDVEGNETSGEGAKKFEYYFSDDTITAELSEDKNTVTIMKDGKEANKLDVSDIEATTVYAIDDAETMYSVSDSTGDNTKVFIGDKAVGTFKGYASVDGDNLVISEYKYNDSTGEVVSGKVTVMDMEGNTVYESTGSEIVEQVIDNYMIIKRNNYIGICNMKGEYLYKTVVLE